MGGETYCREAIDEFLKEKGVIKTPACEGSDPESCGCSTVGQADYRGTISETASGRTCQRWDSNEPHSHSRKRANYPNAGLEENYCRNPDGEPASWCYTTDPDKRWDFCDVPVCDCHECDDTPTPKMIRRGETCASEIDDLDNKCNKHGAWISNNYCELSCFNSGNGYYGSSCCNGNET